MVWSAEPFEDNMCEITHFQMFCLSDRHNFTLAQNIPDSTGRTFEILINVLRPDHFYTCNGYIFVTLTGFSPPSEPITFESSEYNVSWNVAQRYFFTFLHYLNIEF